jgi:catechol 2,3-dioxygenase-like lactoylglutathione lyase family enzyme
MGVMSLAHLTLPTQEVEKTAAFFERTLGYTRLPVPKNSPVELVWLDLGRGQEMHVFFVEGFRVSPFEDEFGRHVAVFFPLSEFTALKARLGAAGAVLFDPIRPLRSRVSSSASRSTLRVRGHRSGSGQRTRLREFTTGSPGSAGLFRTGFYLLEPCGTQA